MYIPDKNHQPLFPVPSENSKISTDVTPPRCAFPLVEPLTTKVLGDLIPKPYRILKNIRSISTHTHRNAAIDNNDTLWTWGAVSMGSYKRDNCLIDNGVTKYYDNSVIYTNDAPQDVSYVPVKIMDNVHTVSTGEWYFMCVTKDGKLWGWGKNEHGQLGLGDYEERKEPTFIMDQVTSVFAGTDRTYIIKQDDSLWRCGNNTINFHASTEKGHNNFTHFFNDVKYVSIGFCTDLIYVDMAIKNNEELWGWGVNDERMLFTQEPYKNYDVPVQLMNHVKSVALSTTYSNYGFVILQNSDLYSFGGFDNSTMVTFLLRKKNGQTPIKVMENVKEAYIGGDFSLVLLNDGRLYACGENGEGQCGTGKSTNQIKKPRLIMSNVIEAAAGHFHAMALQKNGDLWIWGGDYSVSS